jgi:hypothetical protein
MKKFTVLSLVSAAAMALASAVVAQGVVHGSANPYHVAGEKLDSGLGSLTAADIRPYMRSNQVAGEKVDSGLGELSAADLAPYMNPNHVAGEKIDSGLGQLTAADVAPYMNPNHVAGEKIDSGLGEITARRSDSALIHASN